MLQRPGSNLSRLESLRPARPDGNVELLLTVSLEPGWYMYSTVPVSGGPMATSFTADESSAFTLSGGLQDVEEAHVKFDEGFGIDVKYFEGTAQFRQVIVPASQETFTVTGYLEYQTCNRGVHKGGPCCCAGRGIRSL